MGSRTEGLQSAFMEFLKIPEMVFAAKVTAVNKEEKTITVTDEGISYPDVRLSSVINGNNKVIVYPEPNTSVLVGLIGNDENTLFVCSVDTVESIEGVIGECKFLIDNNGYHLTKRGLNVKDLLVDGFENQNKLNKELQKVVVSIGVTPNVPVLKEIENQIRRL
ncbi:MAG TPA: hypothetical protein DDY16_01740 [Tenacibaculum sp.]|nr:hypothetical protein [Tenacibaculum sp.]